MYTLATGKLGFSLVPLVQNLFPLLLAEHRQTIDGLGIVGDHGLQQREKVSNVTMDGRSFEERACVLDDSTNGVAGCLQGKCHVELGHSMRRRLEGLQLQARKFK